MVGPDSLPLHRYVNQEQLHDVSEPDSPFIYTDVEIGSNATEALSLPGCVMRV